MATLEDLDKKLDKIIAWQTAQTGSPGIDGGLANTTGANSTQTAPRKARPYPSPTLQFETGSLVEGVIPPSSVTMRRARIDQDLNNQVATMMRKPRLDPATCFNPATAKKDMLGYAEAQPEFTKDGVDVFDVVNDLGKVYQAFCKDALTSMWDEFYVGTFKVPLPPFAEPVGYQIP